MTRTREAKPAARDSVPAAWVGLSPAPSLSPGSAADVCDLRHHGRRLDRLSARNQPRARDDCADQRDILRGQGAWRVGADDDTEKADQAQHCHGAGQRQQRQGAALPGGHRQPEESVSQDDECERVKRSCKAIMQFRPVLAGLGDEQRVVGARPQQLPNRFSPGCSVGDAGAGLRSDHSVGRSNTVSVER